MPEMIRRFDISNIKARVKESDLMIHSYIVIDYKFPKHLEVHNNSVK